MSAEGRSVTPRRQAPKGPAEPPQQSLSRRQDIIRTAATVFARKGVVNATVRDIGEAVGILSGSLYHHFSSKDEMVEEILRDVLDYIRTEYRFVADSDLSAADALVRLCEAGVTFITERPDEAAILQNDVPYLRQIPRFQFIEDLNREIRHAWTTVLRRGVEDGSFRKDLDVELTYKMTMGGLLTVVRWYDPAGRYSPEHIAHGIARNLLHGVAAQHP